MYVYIYIHMYVYIYIYTHVCMYVCIYINISGKIIELHGPWESFQQAMSQEANKKTMANDQRGSRVCWTFGANVPPEIHPNRSKLRSGSGLRIEVASA